MKTIGSLDKIKEGSDEERLKKFDKLLSEAKIKRYATFDKYVIGLRESGELVRVVIVEGKILSTETMDLQLHEEVKNSKRAMVEWCIGGPMPDEDEFAQFLDDISSKEAKIAIAERKLDKFLANMPKPKEDWIKTFGEEKASLQTIGKVLEDLSAISKVAEGVSNGQKMGKEISEHAAYFAKPLETLVSTLRDALGTGDDQVGANKFIEQFSNHWQNLSVTGKFLKNANDLK